MLLPKHTHSFIYLFIYLCILFFIFYFLFYLFIYLFIYFSFFFFVEINRQPIFGPSKPLLLFSECHQLNTHLLELIELNSTEGNMHPVSPSFSVRHSYSWGGAIESVLIRVYQNGANHGLCMRIGSFPSQHACTGSYVSLISWSLINVGMKDTPLPPSLYLAFVARIREQTSWILAYDGDFWQPIRFY